MVIDINVAAAVKNFLLNYAEVHGLPSPVRNVNRVTQSIIFLPAEMSYKSVHRDFLAGLEEDSNLCALKYDAFRKLWHHRESEPREECTRKPRAPCTVSSRKRIRMHKYCS